MVIRHYLHPFNDKLSTLVRTNFDWLIDSVNFRARGPAGPLLLVMAVVANLCVLLFCS